MGRVCEMNLPAVFDQARDEHYAGGYERRFPRAACKRCKYMVVYDDYEGCSAKGYSVPFYETVPIRRKCRDFREG